MGFMYFFHKYFFRIHQIPEILVGPMCTVNKIDIKKLKNKQHLPLYVSKKVVKKMNYAINDIISVMDTNVTLCFLVNSK